MRIEDTQESKVPDPIYYPDGSRIQGILEVTGAPGKKLKKLRFFAPVLTNTGEVVAEAIDNECCSGSMWVRVVEGTASLTRRARANNVVFYRDVCLGAVPGVEAHPKKWAMWQAVARLRAKGHAVADGAVTMDQLYHPECARRREQNAGGIKHISKDEMAKIFAEVEAELGEGLQAEVQELARQAPPDTQWDNPTETLEEMARA